MNVQYKDVTPIIAELVRLKNSIPLEVDVGRYLPEVRKNTHGEAVRSGLKKALRVIEQAPVVGAMPRWISVEERLPQDGRIVAFIPSCNHGSVYVGVLTNIGQRGGVMFSHREGRYKSNYYAKYWMPLPEPPKED